MNKPNKWISILANAFIFWILIMLFGMFYVLEKTSTLVVDKFDGQKSILTELWQPIYFGGIILVSGLTLMLVTKGLKKDIWTVVVGIITLAVYFWKIKINGI